MAIKPPKTNVTLRFLYKVNHINHIMHSCNFQINLIIYDGVVVVIGNWKLLRLTRLSPIIFISRLNIDVI
jgi:hypothetical protein